MLILRTRKPKTRSGRVLLIDASAEVTRRNAQSFLEDEHIKKIANAYAADESIEGFSAYATINEIASKDYSLSIPLYVRAEASATVNGKKQTPQEAAAMWEIARMDRASAFETVRSYLIENGGDPRE